MMKKLIYILIFAAAAPVMLLPTSCSTLEDTLSPESPSSFESATVYSNVSLADYAVVGIYQYFTIDRSYRNRYNTYYGFNTDIEWYNSANTDASKSDEKSNLAGFNTSANSSNEINQSGERRLFSIIYQAIEQCNLNIQGLRTYGNVSANPDMAHLLGESLTMRAMFYYDLIKAWGDVPARFEPVTQETIYIPKSDRDDIFKQIIADLQEAAPMMYWPGESTFTSTTGRANRAFADGLLARICLAAAGYAWRPDDGQVGKGNFGSYRRSTRVESGEWANDKLYEIALAACQDVISQENVHVMLEPEYEQLWRDVCTWKNDAVNRETIFAMPFGHTTLRGRWLSNNAIKHNAVDQYCQYSSGGGSVGPVPTMYYEFEANDVRRDLTCVNYAWSAESNSVQIPADFNKWYFGKYRYEWTSQVITSTDDGIMPIVLRYADVLLMAAECYNQLGQLDKAKAEFQKVRMRAYAGNEGDVTAYMAKITDKDAMLKAIMHERALEFCGEYLRKGDLIRWGIFGKAILESRAKMLAIRDHGTYTSEITGRKYDYSTLGTYLYYRYVGDLNSVGKRETIEMWGLNPGEQDAPKGQGWTQLYKDDGSEPQEYIKDSSLNDNKIATLDGSLGSATAKSEEAINSRMYWPIFSQDLSANPSIVNDFGY